MTQFIPNVDSIISITLYDEMKSDYQCKWHPPRTKMKRPKWWKKPEEVTINGYYHGRYNQYVTLERAIKSYDKPGKFKIEMLGSKTGKLEQGPDGTAFVNAHAYIRLVGGKYVGEHTVYFDNGDQMSHWIQELLGKHQDKFTIIKGN
jgi:hypothetical protein